MQKASNIKTYSFIVLAILLSKVLGLARDMLLASHYGTGVEAQAFAAASRVPLTFFDITLGTAVASAFIPVFNGYLGENRKERAFQFVNVFISVVAVIAAVLSLLLILFPQVGIFLMASQFEPETAALAASLLQKMAPIVLIAVLAYSYVAVLQSLGEFTRPAIMSLLSNVAMIVYFLVLDRRFGIQGLAVSLTVGWLLQLAILIRPLRQKGVGFQFIPRVRDEGMRQVLLLALPVLISSWSTPINNIISGNISSQFDTGFSVMDYAYKLYFMMAGVFSMALTNLFFPRMSRNYAKGAEGENFQLLCDLLTNITMVVMPFMLFFILFAQDIVRTVYQREGGAFTAADTVVVGMVLAAYSFGMMGLSWQEILNKFFYSSHDSRTPMYVSFVGIGLNVVLSIVLSRAYGVAGIGIASTLSVTFIALALMAVVCWKNRRPLSGLALDLAKVLLAAVVCGAALLGIHWLLGGFEGGLVWSLCKMAVAFGVAVLLYVGLLIGIRAGQAPMLLSVWKRRDD
ncbi:MAG: murein biosynthesis integral membrane protein MurJ [Eubacteriales bacterium]